MDGKFIAYYRVSTDRQGVNGNGMAAQRKAVEDYLNGGRWKLVGEFTEVESPANAPIALSLKRPWRLAGSTRQSLSSRSWIGFPATSISSAA